MTEKETRRCPACDRLLSDPYKVRCDRCDREMNPGRMMCTEGDDNDDDDRNWQWNGAHQRGECVDMTRKQAMGYAAAYGGTARKMA